MWRKRRSKRKFSGKLLKIWWIIPVLLVLILLYLFLKSGIFNIKHVDVQASQLGCADENQVRNSANLTGQNFFLINSTKVENDLKKNFFCIKSSSVSRSLPDRVKLQVFAREAVAQLVTLKEKEASVSSLINIATPSARQVQDFYRVDGESVVFLKDTFELSIPKIYIYDPGISLGKRLGGDLIGNSLKILEKVKSLGIEIKESWIYDNFFIINSEVSKLKIIFRLNEKLDVQLASLQLIVDKAKIDLKEFEFMDLRFDKPVVRFAPEK